MAASQQFNLLPPEIQSAQLQDLTNALGEQKPLSLPEFYAQLPGDQWAAVDLRQAITAFAKQNSREASIWVNQLPNNEARDTAVSGLVDYLLVGAMPDLEAAAHWAASSTDPEAQTRRLQRVAKAWNKTNPSGAANAINNSQLSEPVRQQLLQYLTPANP
ncbi:MAG: hypothetical protein JWL81_131 [Verrucomicrobiales bacterium]|nr:hypothetical protein [Verrucomicrobiales bacterium]